MMKVSKKAVEAVKEKTLLTTDEACIYMGGMFSRSALAHLRCNQDPSGPRYVKFGRQVRYRKEDLDSFLERNVVDPTLFRKRYDKKR